MLHIYLIWVNQDRHFNSIYFSFCLFCTHSFHPKYNSIFTFWNPKSRLQVAERLFSWWCCQRVHPCIPAPPLVPVFLSVMFLYSGKGIDMTVGKNGMWGKKQNEVSFHIVWTCHYQMSPLGFGPCHLWYIMPLCTAHRPCWFFLSSVWSLHTSSVSAFITLIQCSPNWLLSTHAYAWPFSVLPMLQNA